ncbi:sugar ABC transporter ATP-binding protein [Paenibacillus terrigena]|uniref:sugar ABC transporter ATP-binding protein n=1 Tax=Paenibacillus terrigena TaxID=369333 RepID=UPI0028D12A10|nr:sugar ABC transporter ATP-binding protein [Paenibacillus terrigena]
MKKEPLLIMKDISKSFGAVQALMKVNLELYSGEVLALLGENGAGKSTLMNILSGGVPSYQGDIEISGERAHIHSPMDARQAGVAKIHQELQLVPELSVAENIYIGREPCTKLGFIDRRRMNLLAKQYLDLLDLHVEPDLPVKRLRIGEQQLVEIAKALSLHAKVLIMDEPTSALSRTETRTLFHIINKIAAEGVSIIYITHRMEEIFELTHRVTVLRDGAAIGTVDTASTNHDELVGMMAGRSITELYPSRESCIGREILRVEHLHFNPPRHTNKRKLQDISLHLHRGEVLGIAGLLGSGRSELFECIYGLHTNHSKARMYIDGVRVQMKKPRDAIHRGISFVTEDRKGQGLVLGRSIGENMSLPLLRAFSKMTFMLRKVEAGHWQEQMDSLKIKAPSYHEIVGHLSGGNQQKVILGRWLLVKPQILLLDEPTRGIDVGAKSEIYQVINKLAANGLGIIVISSDLPEVIGLSDRILTFCEGRLTGEFTQQEATQEKLLSAATRREEVNSGVESTDLHEFGFTGTRRDSNLE